jgi:adenylate cyclase class 2
MCHEIEAKLKVDSLEVVEQRLQQLGATFEKKFLQTDIYFDHNNLNLTNNDVCLRIRKQTSDSEEKIFLTYKGPKEEDNYKKRREIELQIHDATAAEKLFTALGYVKEIIVEKERRQWRLVHCAVLLDDLQQLGTFVEIEGPNANDIESIQKDLQLDNLPHIQESYAHLITEKLVNETLNSEGNKNQAS